MKTTVAILFLWAAITGCKGTKYTKEKEVDTKNYYNEKSVTIAMKDGYELYVRQVIKVFDSTTKMYLPANAPANNKDKLIEIEYLLWSQKTGNIIVWNNIPSIYQNTGSGNRKGFFVTGDTNTINIDVYYLRQFRFGKMGSPDEFAFKNANGSGKNHVWKYLLKNDTLVVDAVSIRDNFGETTIWASAAISLDIIYRKAKAFKIVYIKKDSDSAEQTIELPDQTFIMGKSKDGWSAIFPFGPALGGDGNIIFPPKRMYCPPDF